MTAKTKNKKKLIKFLLVVFIILLSIILLLGGMAFWYVQNKIGKMKKVEIDE